MRINREIRAPSVRVIGSDGSQLGVMVTREAIRLAEQTGEDLVEVASNANPPVCRIVDYGKYRYEQTKKEKESKKLQHQVKVKEVKFKPNIDKNDLNTKVKRAREFLEKGNKVRFSCMFRGREMLHTDIGRKIMKNICQELDDISLIEAPLKQMGRIISLVLAPLGKKKKKESQSSAKDENA